MARRRFTLYFSWSRPQETEATLGVLDNRYPALFEFRRAIWPHYEWASDPAKFDQGIAGFLDDVVLFDFERFRSVIEEITGEPVQLIQRINSLGGIRRLDIDILRAVDTLIVVSLDHVTTGQHAAAAEVEALGQFLERDEACLVVCPHHDIGESEVQTDREVEYRHHGDPLVPPQQRIGGFARSLLQALDVPLVNRYGLSPGRDPVDGGPGRLQVAADLDDLGLLRGVDTFNLHPHLPHLEVGKPGALRVLARQPINPVAAPHPYVDAGNRYFNALVWLPPAGRRAGNVIVGDATLWSSAFGGAKSLERFWANLAAVGTNPTP